MDDTKCKNGPKDDPVCDQCGSEMILTDVGFASLKYECLNCDNVTARIWHEGTDNPPDE